ncbi:MAG: HEAT repeat domain-containing protein [Elusimicrobiota bacterium]|nr:HEAT repeat domain-containing protein [Elusimicrobiota bacterium]
MLPLAAFCVACACASVWAAEPARPARAKANLRGRTAAERREAAELAVRRGRGAPSAADLDAAAAMESNPQVRYELLRALAAADPVAALPTLTRALRSDTAPIVRVAAAQELGRLDDRAAARALIAALAGDADLDVRRAAASSLGVSRSTEAAVALAAAAEQADPGVRRHAARALLRHPGAAADKALERLAGDKDASVSAAAKATRADRAARAAAGRRGRR